MTDAHTDHWRDLPTLPAHTHRHFCGHQCGNFHTCTREDCHDKDVWTCPSCDLDERDADMTLEELKQAHSGGTD